MFEKEHSFAKDRRFRAIRRLEDVEITVQKCGKAHQLARGGLFISPQAEAELASLPPNNTRCYEAEERHDR